MLDARFIRENEATVRQSLKNRYFDESILEQFLSLDGKWRELIEEGNGLRRTRNEVSEQISKLDKEEKAGKIAEMKTIAQRIKEIEDDVRRMESERDDLLLNMPNMPDPSVPVGRNADDNPTVKEWGTIRKFDFKPLPHWEIGENLGIIDFDRGVKITGTGFYVLKGDGARLERALINYMLDL
ncbi:MAG: serine--tRNA ligase, partial [Methanomassiliicoccus sp.]